MGLSIWSEEGNVQDLSFWFLPPKEKETAAQAADTPSYLDEWNYAKAPEKKEATMAMGPEWIVGVGLIVVALFALGVIKL